MMWIKNIISMKIEGAMFRSLDRGFFLPEVGNIDHSGAVPGQL